MRTKLFNKPMKIIQLVLVLPLFWLMPLSSIIIEAYDLDEIATHLQNLNPQSLLLWDVDSTLIIPTDHILCPGNEDILDDFSHHYLAKKSEDEIVDLMSQIFLRSPFRLVDQRVLGFIDTLRMQEIPMIAFTACNTGDFGQIERMENWRFNQLHHLGIDFSHMFSQHSSLAWTENSPYKGFPVFMKGILYSDSLPKGPVLSTFLQKIDWRPVQILFIDDTLSYLQSVEQAMKEKDIPFIGIHYRAVEKIDFQLEEEVIHHQFRVLTTEGKWLTDDEAKKALETIIVNQ